MVEVSGAYKHGRYDKKKKKMVEKVACNVQH